MTNIEDLDKLLMIPGPTPVLPEILDAIAQPTISHTSPAMARVVSRCLEGIGEVAGAHNGQPFVFAGAGTLAQEAAIVNLVAPGERLLVVSNGFFSDRFTPMAIAHGIEVETIAARWGESVTPEQLRQRLDGGDFRAVTFTQVETSTGVQAPISALAAVAREAGALVIVDAVCALGGVPVDMDDRGIDILLSGAQKALGVPPGLSILVASERALERRREMGRIAAYYADLLNWLPSMLNPTVYFSTHAVNLFYGLQAALEVIETEGLMARYARHRTLADSFRQSMASLGFTPLTSAEYLAPTLSVLAYPDGVSDEAFRAALSRRGVVAAACLGSFKGKGVRVGHMGNITESEIARTVSAVQGALAEVRDQVATN